MKHSQGFTILELLITLAVIGVLAAVAFPAYQNYVRRAYYSEIVSATVPYKTAVTACFQKLGKLTYCNAGSNHIPSAISKAKGAVASLNVISGVITVTPLVQHGFVATDTYILTPAIEKNTLKWTISGGGISQGYAS